MTSAITVEMGETWVSQVSTEQLVAVGLGACIGLYLYDSTTHIGAMAHIVLPQTPAVSSLPHKHPVPLKPGKCADTAVAYLAAQAVEHGARRPHLQAVIAGGAELFSRSAATSGVSGTAAPSRIEIGPRNVEAVRLALEAECIPLVAQDTGTHCGRTLTLSIGSGEIAVCRVGAQEQILACLYGTSSQQKVG